MYIYLDESGDLGFDFSKKKTTKHLIITLLISRDSRPFEYAVNRTLKNKINRKKNVANELKGTSTSLSIKKYFYRTLRKHTENFDIYTVILNKKRVYNYLATQPEVLYAYLSKFILEKCPFVDFDDKIILTVDKRSKKQGIESFNKYLLSYLKVNIPKIEIFHNHSYNVKGLQVVDLFCLGIFRKYEFENLEWYNVFRDKIKFETVYLPEK